MELELVEIEKERQRMAEAERALETGAQTPDVRQQADGLRHLVGQGLGVYGVVPDQHRLVMLVEVGMPDEFREVLASAVIGRQVTFREPTSLAKEAVREKLPLRDLREVEAEANADPTGKARRQLDGLRAAEDQRRREKVKVAAAEGAWGFPLGTGEFAFGLMSDMAGMEEDQ